MEMEKNVGTMDRVIRGIVGVVLIAGAVSGSLGWWAFIGIVPLATAAMSYCPAYKLVGINTCPKDGGAA
ncbi:YgaP family membrane protein [Roseospirillum parvum]|uniref:Inner membrane protein YgaP-like transmembrane domain-containing protein n=1 Tax=Roseospirillum parvum TaxID=83401 RepID=A0A1G8AT29_9PROT|nr:Protein of unknown function [Roseospirillum parvum]